MVVLENVQDEIAGQSILFAVMGERLLLGIKSIQASSQRANP
jgi:hypothetical protein